MMPTTLPSDCTVAFATGGLSDEDLKMADEQALKVEAVRLVAEWRVCSFWRRLHDMTLPTHLLSINYYDSGAYFECNVLTSLRPAVWLAQMLEHGSKLGCERPTLLSAFELNSFEAVALMRKLYDYDERLAALENAKMEKLAQ